MSFLLDNIYLGICVLPEYFFKQEEKAQPARSLKDCHEKKNSNLEEKYEKGRRKQFPRVLEIL